MGVLVPILLVLRGTGADSQEVPSADEQQFLDSLDEMPPKELKRFVRSNGAFVSMTSAASARVSLSWHRPSTSLQTVNLVNAGMDCKNCKKKQWMAKAREVVQSSDGQAGWGGGDYATAPDGGMQMSREEFKQQLVPTVFLPSCQPSTTCAC